MGILSNNQTPPAVPANASPFPSDTVLGRMSRGGYKPTDTDLEELRKLAQSGNRADRRAAGKQLKKLGMEVPTATPASPVLLAAPTVAQENAPTNAAAPKIAPKKPALKKTSAGKTAPEKAAPEKAAPKKAAPKKAAPKKAAPKKAASQKAALAKKAATKKTTVKKSAGRKTR